MKNVINVIFNEQRKKSSAIFLHYPKNNYHLSYSELFDQSLAIACALRQYGVKNGDKVLVVFDNVPESVIVAFALMIAGAILVPVEPVIKNDSLQYIIEDSEAKFFIFFDYIPENLNISSLYSMSYKELLNARIESKDISYFTLSPEEIIVILYTSGSTGNPKGIVFDYSSVIENFKEYGRVMKFSNQTRFLQVMPLYHADGWNFTLLVPYLHNCTVVLTPKFNLNVCKDVFYITTEYNCNVLVAIPSILDSITLFSHRYEPDELPKLDYVITSSEKLYRGTKATFEKLFNCEVYDLYGLTETQIVSYYNKDIEWIEGSTGKLQYGVEVNFAEDGELMIKSPYLFKEYCNNKHLTDKVNKEGWFSTGDLGYLSEDGYLFLVGRKNDIINKGGEKIAPSEISSIIKELSFVKDCHTLGIKDDIYGQNILSVVILNKSYQVSNAKSIIYNYCTSKLTHSSVPKQIVFMNSFPLNKVGKKDVLKLKDILRHEYEMEF